MRLFIAFASGLLCLLLAFNLDAQIQVNPKQTIASPNKYEFHASSALFSPQAVSRQLTAMVDPEVSEYELLALDEETLAQMTSRPSENLNLNIPHHGTMLELQLTQVNPVAHDFVLRYASGQASMRPNVGVHYRGTIAGQPETHVALSLLDGELQGLIAQANGTTLVLGPLEGTSRETANTYILYKDDPVFASQDFDCGTEDSGVAYRTEQLTWPASQRSSTGNCVKVYFEVDYNIYQDKGSNTAAYVVAAFNEVAALYSTINVDLSISEIFVWDQFSPYGGNSSGTLLTQFQSQRPNFNGDIAQLLSYSASGGIAVLSGLCHPISAARMSFSSIGNTFQTVPTYSWTVMVIAHELGHLLGSQHTHACVWNGNETAIDGCAGFTEGSCGNPGIPQNGGGIMSYCHLTSAGINFNVGFGDQPGAAIFNFVNSANCINGDNCDNNPPPPPPPPTSDSCEQFTTILEITLDNFGPETTWTLENEVQQVLYSGGPYAKKQAGVTKRDTFCLPEACYVLRIKDEHEDGLCCEYGAGSYRLIGPDNQIIALGDTFSNVAVVDFCLPDSDPPIVIDSCINVDFNDFDIISYGQTQDAGQFSIHDNGKELAIRNNAWKAIELPYELTENTVITFEFRSTLEGEIHGIGFDDNDGISPDLTFRLHGTQSWGNGDFDHYNGDGQWQQFIIPVGEYLTGPSSYLFFCADHDLGFRNGNSHYRNINIYESTPCAFALPANTLNNTIIDESLSISPNPVAEQLQFMSPSEGVYQVVNNTGQVIKQGAIQAGQQQVSLANLPAGTYFLRHKAIDGTEVTRRFVKL